MTQKTTAVATAQNADKIMPFASVASFETAQRMAQLLASSDLVPDSYKGKVGNIVIALDIANRMGASPLMVMQNLYIVLGQPSWSSKFLIAMFNQCGRFSLISYEINIEGDKSTWYCIAKSTDLATGEEVKSDKITWAMVEAEGWSKKNGSKWLTMPGQMFRYRSAAFLIRATAPEITFGFLTLDEVADGVNEIVDVPSEEVKVLTDAKPAEKTPFSDDLFAGKQI